MKLGNGDRYSSHTYTTAPLKPGKRTWHFAGVNESGKRKKYEFTLGQVAHEVRYSAVSRTDSFGPDEWDMNY